MPLKDGNQQRKEREWPRTILQVLLGFLSFGLLIEGGYLAYLNLVPAATSAFSFGFLSLSITLLSKFKRIEAFGFKAEMWDQEQVKAAELVKQLESVSDTVIDQMTLFGSQFGLASGGGIEADREALLEQLEQLCRFRQYGAEAVREKLEPLYIRLGFDYCWKAEAQIKQALESIQVPGVDNRQFQLSLDALREVSDLRYLIKIDCLKYIEGLIIILNKPDLLPTSTARAIRELENLKSKCSQLKTKRELN